MQVTTVTRIRASGTVARVEHRLDSIFVSIASYRDAECHKTIADLYRKAAFPERVFVGAVDQVPNLQLPDKAELSCQGQACTVTALHCLDGMFESVARYRDAECCNTIASLFRKGAFSF